MITQRCLNLKALYREALKILKKAKEIAVKYKKQSQLLEILIAERNIMVVLPDKNILENRKKIFDEGTVLSAEIKKYFDYSWLSDQILIFVEQRGDFTTENREKEMAKLFSHPYLADESLADDYIYKNYFYHAHLFYQLSKNNIPEVQAILKKEIELLEANMHFVEDNPRNYITTLINFLLASNLIKKRDDVNQGIVKLNKLRRKLKNKVPLNLELHILFHSLNAEILVYRNNCDMKRGRIAVKKIEAAVSHYSNDVPGQLKISLLSNAATFYFIDEKYEQSLNLINLLLNEASVNFRSDVNSFAKILQILIHLELENYDLLEYLVGSTYKYFKEKKEIYKAESALFDFFKQTLKLGKDEMHDAFEELNYKFKKLANDSHTQNLFAMFNFPAWIESKVRKVKLADVLREKYD